MLTLSMTIMGLTATMAHAKDPEAATQMSCGMKLGKTEESLGKPYEAADYRTDYQDVRPLPLQTDADREDFSLHVKSDNGERYLLEVLTVARFECSWL